MDRTGSKRVLIRRKLNAAPKRKADEDKRELELWYAEDMSLMIVYNDESSIKILGV
jgi:hypothetical protein